MPVLRTMALLTVPGVTIIPPDRLDEIDNRHEGLSAFKSVVADDGSFRTWEHIENHHRDPHGVVEGDWSTPRYMYRGRWRLAPKFKTRSLTVFWCCEQFDDMQWFPAYLAADMAGLDHTVLAAYDRHDDGYFRCPFCKEKRDALRPFAHHLDNDHYDAGGKLMLRYSRAFEPRNCHSRKAWLRERAPAPTFSAPPPDGC